MSFLLEVTDYTKPVDGFVDKLLFGGQMVLIGMGVVFSVLVLLLLSLYVFKLCFHDIPAKRASKKTVKVVEKNTVSAPVADNTDAKNEEIVAVIAAAIAMAESESDGLKFRVVSFKRK